MYIINDNIEIYVPLKVFYHTVHTCICTMHNYYVYVSTYILDFYLSAQSLKEDKSVKMFIKSLSLHLISSSHHGHVDIFAPLTTSGKYLHMYVHVYDYLRICTLICTYVHMDVFVQFVVIRIYMHA